MDFINIDFLLSAVLPKLIKGTFLSLVVGAVVGGIVGLIIGTIAKRKSKTFFPALFGSFLGTLLLAFLPVLANRELDSGGAYGLLTVLNLWVVLMPLGSIGGAIAGSLLGLELSSKRQQQVLWISLGLAYSIMIIGIYLGTAPSFSSSSS
ncbi:hypothetical protein JOY44_04345 [Phormidium sp. CLA17]|uniref:hypothetical protein n=1 Tax=Leptolyngbya sp. Cla-17 TaxID=2803751 RepID=UPI00149316DE|nr:hypothetical protein [Leptolyngbya sp. Cla-17]MBM0740853.1 hypothetical protein [Leptolyngbya sp. Cla-17]